MPTVTTGGAKSHILRPVAPKRLRKLLYSPRDRTIAMTLTRADIKELTDPLNLAGMGTWVLIAADQLLSRGLFGDASRLVTAALLLAFLLAFITSNLAGNRGQDGLSRALCLLMIPISLADAALTPSVSAPILLVITAAMIAGRFPLRISILLVAAANLVYFFIYRDLWDASRPLYQTALFASFQAFALFVARMGFAAETARTELAQANAHLLATRSLLEASARDGERLRLSRELHDLAGHHLTALKLTLELARRVPEAERGPKIDQALALSNQLLDDIRGVVGQLREHDGLQLEPALRQLADGLPGVGVDLAVDPTIRIANANAATALLRCAQESLTNAVRHGHARQVRLDLQADDGGVRLTVTDSGAGAPAIAPGNGLTGMRERLQAVGGRVDWSSRPGQGFAVSAWVPQAA